MKDCFDQVEIYIEDDDNRFGQNADYYLPNVEVRTIDFRPYMTQEFIALHKLKIWKPSRVQSQHNWDHPSFK